MSTRGPNILITGTPGTGKTTLAEELSTMTGLRHINIGDVARENNFFDGWDDERECHILDDDRVIDEIEAHMSSGTGSIVDHHDCDYFPKRWFDVVFVLRTDNTILYNRLELRGYSKTKIQENVQCEIMQVLLDEAREAYDTEIVHELQSNNPEQMQDNLDQITSWVNYWRQQHPEPIS